MSNQPPNTDKILKVINPIHIRIDAGEPRTFYPIVIVHKDTAHWPLEIFDGFDAVALFEDQQMAQDYCDVNNEQKELTTK